MRKVCIFVQIRFYRHEADNIRDKYQVFTKEELPDKYNKLIDEAIESTQKAYAPYSNFYVGAAVLLANEKIITGNNQENAAYPSGLCAERVALFYAGAQHPDVPVEAIAIVAFTKGKQVNLITPCGGCRQVLLEVENRFKNPMKVILCGTKEIYIAESAKSLLPLCFDGSDL